VSDCVCLSGLEGGGELVTARASGPAPSAQPVSIGGRVVSEEMGDRRRACVSLSTACGCERRRCHAIPFPAMLFFWLLMVNADQ
jgi:hypothetical protein